MSIELHTNTAAERSQRATLQKARQSLLDGALLPMRQIYT